MLCYGMSFDGRATARRVATGRPKRDRTKQRRRRSGR